MYLYFLLRLVLVLSLQGQMMGVWHTDWSEGPGVLGPVEDPNDWFFEEENIEWAASPGNLLLEAPTARYLVTDQIAGLDAAITVADVNTDGQPDIFYGTWYPGGLGWCENVDNGSSWILHIISSDAASHVDTDDLDGDGDPDLLIALTQDDILAWFENSDGSWIRHDIIPAPDMPLRLCGSDIDSDGDADLLTFTDNQSILWYENTDGSGMSWQEHTMWTFVPDAGLAWVEPAQLDSDTPPEILFALHNDGDLGYLDYQPGERSWQRVYIETTANFAWDCIDAGDIDGDGDEDVVASRDMNGLYYLEWFNNPGWNRTLITRSIWGNGDYLMVSDLDDNGNSDILTSVVYGQTAKAYLQKGGTGIDWYMRIVMENDDGRGVASGDFDGDGINEPVGIMSNNTEGRIEWCDFTLDGYPSSGCLTTSIFIVPFGTDLYTVIWGAMLWDAFEPEYTSVGFQVRASADWENMGEWSDTIWVNGELLEALLPEDGIYVQCKVHLGTINSDNTPIVEWFCAEGFVPGGIEEDPEDVKALAILTNPSGRNPVFLINLPYSSGASLQIYDITGRKVVDENLSHLGPGRFEYQSSLSIPGVYFVRLQVGGITADLRFLVIAD